MFIILFPKMRYYYFCKKKKKKTRNDLYCSSHRNRSLVRVPLRPPWKLTDTDTEAVTNQSNTMNMKLGTVDGVVKLFKVKRQIKQYQLTSRDT